MNTQNASSNSAARWLPAAAAGGLVAAVVAAGVISGSGGDPASSTPTSGSTAFAATTAVATVPTESYEAVEPSGETVEKVPLSQSLSKGNWGDEVEMVQERLAELAFDPGPIDGQFRNLSKWFQSMVR